MLEIHVPCMKHHAAHPRDHAHVGHAHIIRTEGVRSRHERVDLAVQRLVMDHEIPKREQHAKGLLDAEEALKGPFSVELDRRKGRGGREPLGGDDVLAGVVAF